MWRRWRDRIRIWKRSQYYKRTGLSAGRIFEIVKGGSVNSDPLVFTGSDSLILFKCPDKVAEIVKTVPVGNFCN